MLAMLVHRKSPVEIELQQICIGTDHVSENELFRVCSIDSILE